MNKSTVWTVLGVIAAIVIAWILVDVMFSVLLFIGKVVIVGIFAVIVFLVLRRIFAGRDDRA